MKLVSALVGLAALGGVALTGTAASATPIDVPVARPVAGRLRLQRMGPLLAPPLRGWTAIPSAFWGGYGAGITVGSDPWGYGGGYGWHPHWGGGWLDRWHHWHQW